MDISFNIGIICLRFEVGTAVLIHEKLYQNCVNSTETNPFTLHGSDLFAVAHLISILSSISGDRRASV